MYNGQEKRQYRRIEKQFMARLQIKSDKAQEAESDNWDSVTLMNLSAGGTFFYYKKALKIGTFIDLQIDVSESTPPISCVGEVIRSDKLQPAFSICIAVSFVDIGEQEINLINKIAEGTFR